MTEIRFTMVVRSADRIDQLKQLVERDHSSRIAVLNKALDCLVDQERRLEQLAAGLEVSHV